MITTFVKPQPFSHVIKTKYKEINVNGTIDLEGRTIVANLISLTPPTRILFMDELEARRKLSELYQGYQITTTYESKPAIFP